MATTLSNMKGKYARVTAISPRPEGVYRFSVRMRAAVPMSVTIQALGVWETFNISTSWAQYDILIEESVGDNIDFYPLADNTMYVEKLQLTYGKATYEWRPAPEDEVEYEWTRVALDEVKIENIREIVSYTEYFYLTTAGAAPPSAPSTNPPPEPWTASEAMDSLYTATATASEPLTASVTAATFISAVNGSAGVHRFTWDGASWMYDGSQVSLRDYGVGVVGTPTAGDSVAVLVQIDTNARLYRCAVTLYSDGTFQWGEVTPAASFDAAKAALSTSTRYSTQVQQLMDSWDVKVRATTVDDETQETVADMMGRIQVTESTISNLIDVVQKSDDGLNERISSLQTQTSRDIRNTFTEAKEYADEQYGVARDYVTTAQTWQRFSADGIEQGKLGSPFKSKLNNEELGFYENEQKVAYISNHKFMITVGEVEDSLMIGNFEFTSSENGLGIIYGRRG